MTLQQHELKSLAIEMAAAMPPSPLIKGTQMETMDRLNDASADLAAVRALLLVLAAYVEGEAESAVYGIETLLSAAKDKLDRALQELPI